MRPLTIRRAAISDGLWAGATAAVLSGLPSTTWALATGRDPLEAAWAAGSLLLPADTTSAALLGAGAVAHVAISLGWAIVLAAWLPERQTVLSGIMAGAGIALLDLGVIGRWFPLIARLDFIPQLADHLAYGAAASWVIQGRRRRRHVART
jgi:hypothetical protein